MTDFLEAFDRLNQFVMQAMPTLPTPGLALALTDRERTLRVACYGAADAAARAPVTPDTLFEIGSIGKSFTTLALLQLHAAGRVDLQAPVERYLPWFQVPSRFAPITLHHLLSHTAGIIMGADQAPAARPEIWALHDTGTASAPGEHFHYSNTGFKTLGVILEDLLGQPYGEIIRERILIPLGMTATDPVITHDTRRRLAVGYEPFYDDRPLPRGGPLAPATWFQTDTADGSLASTPGDMAIYLRMLLNRGRGIVGPAEFELMTRRVIPVGPEMPEQYYGYGLGVAEAGGRTQIGHGGGMVGYRAYLLGDLDDGVGAIVLVNGPGDARPVARFALELLHATLHGEDLPPVSPEDPTRIDNATDYAGTYRAAGRELTLAAEDAQLLLSYGGQRIVLERRWPDYFYVDHPDFVPYLLHFGRDAGKVVEVLHGPAWYLRPEYSGPTEFDNPRSWDAFTGHYRSHNPWQTNFRVVLRKGGLVLIQPAGEEEPLVPMWPSVFRVGQDGHSPERIRFGPLVDGHAIRANLSGGDYYRVAGI